MQIKSFELLAAPNNKNIADILQTFYQQKIVLFLFLAIAI